MEGIEKMEELEKPFDVFFLFWLYFKS